MSVATELQPLTDRVREGEAGRVRVLTLRTPVEQVVSFEGSFLTYPDFEAGEEIQQQLAIALLDKGTRRRDRFALAEALDDRGAQLSFSADGLRSSFAGRCLSEDLGFVLDVASEQLREPLFDPEEFRKARAQQIAAVRRIMEDTGSQAHGALARRLYAPSHPNHRPEPEQDLAHLDSLSVDDVRAYHEGHFGARGAVVTIVGDVDEDAASGEVARVLGDWAEPTAAGLFATEATPSDSGRENLPMQDRPNLDVRIAQPIPLRRDHADFLPLYVGVYILGGNFSARLMTAVRDEMGLTYGIGARLSGVSIHHDAYFLTSVTLSGESLEPGIEATLGEIRRFVEGGVTEGELEEKKTTLTGSFKVGLASSRGLASALQSNAEREFDVAYLDRFPELINRLTVDEVHRAIRRHLDPGALHVAVAGAMPGA